MKHNHNLFTPETVDEHIEQLAHMHPAEQSTPDARLVATLRRVYRPKLSSQDRRSLEYIKQRIDNLRDHSSTLPHNTTHTLPVIRPLSKRYRLYSTLAATLLIGLIIGSWLAIMHLVYPNLTHPGAGTPTPVPPSASRDNLYIADGHTISKIRSSDGSRLWQRPLNMNNTTPLLTSEQGIIYLWTPTDAYAFSAGSGSQLWHFTPPDGSILTVTSGLVYTNNQSTANFTVYNGQNGLLTWSEHTLYIRAIHIINDVLYAKTTQNSLFAFAAQSGKLLWHFDEAQNPTPGSTWPFQVINNRIYDTAANHLYVLDASGQYLWTNTIKPDEHITTIHIANGGIYLGSTPAAPDPAATADTSSNTVYAFDQDGQGLWNVEGYTLSPSLPPGFGIVFAYSAHQPDNPRSGGLEAIDASSGNQLWRMNDQCTGNTCNTSVIGTVNEQLYALANGQLISIDIQSGQQQTAHPTNIFTSQQSLVKNGIAYLLASNTNDPANTATPNQPSTHTQEITAINLQIGITLWHYPLPGPNPPAITISP
ncbi:MAG: PQQ-binding-like beta-propeller repeat protein [Ktedonobacteraceae bacterium]|nr:PQQ-binding-like beta-propeller repeat protein [Ktedonobacteraceae bacterium]